MTVVLNLDRQISVARVKTSKKSVTVEEISNYPYEAQQFFESNELRMMIRENIEQMVAEGEGFYITLGSNCDIEYRTFGIESGSLPPLKRETLKTYLEDIREICYRKLPEGLDRNSYEPCVLVKADGGASTYFTVSYFSKNQLTILRDFAKGLILLGVYPMLYCIKKAILLDGQLVITGSQEIVLMNDFGMVVYKRPQVKNSSTSNDEALAAYLINYSKDTFPANYKHTDVVKMQDCISRLCVPFNISDNSNVQAAITTCGIEIINSKLKAHEAVPVKNVTEGESRFNGIQNKLRQLLRRR